MSTEHEAGREGGELDLLSGRTRSARLLDGLSDRERAAVTHRGRRLVIRGAAGTGKTWLIEHRFRWLVGQGTRPERLGVLVPSSGRALALRERLETGLELAYDELHVLTPPELAGLILARAGAGSDPLATALSAGDRLAMLVERIDELSLQHHDFGGRPNLLLAGFVRRIDRLKAELVDPDAYAAWATALSDDARETAVEREFSEVYRTHERMLTAAGTRDAGDLVSDAISLTRQQPEPTHAFAHLLI
ncbi:MAG: UvrD-helicase domain-containing protein, partial [Actinomycetota bacterium]|nr:UvrD-helicase domain-containing protein [Actinomycetota bacterium]